MKEPDDCEVDGSSDSIFSNHSSSSVQIQYCPDELMERSDECNSSSIRENIRQKGRTNKLLKKYNICLADIPSDYSTKSARDVDLSVPEDHNLDWLTSKFPSIKQPLTKKSSQSAKMASTQRCVKEQLKSSLAIKRRTALQKRWQQYSADNEDLLDELDEEEEEYVQKSKKNSISPIIVNKDLDESEDDSDYHESGGEGDDDDASCSGEASSKDGNVSEKENEENDIDQVTNDVTQNSDTNFPCGLSQWFRNNSSRDNLEEQTDKIVITNKSADSIVQRGDDGLDDVNDPELLLLCSGGFNSIPVELKPSSQISDSSDDVQPKSVRRRRVVDSDSDTEDLFGSSKTTAPAPIRRNQQLRFADDSDGEEDNIKRDDTTIQEDLEDRPCNRDSAVAHENDIDSDSDLSTSPDDPVNEGDLHDSDDELGIVRSLEQNSHNKKSRGNFFDDEASLSGDDIGSDLDEEEDNDEYEAEEGDADVLPDDGVIRLQNHRQLMKQEMAKEHREILQLQDRLLADGDLGGVETNRTFRVCLREQSDVAVEELQDGDMDDQHELEEVDDDSESKKRTLAIKFKLEMENSMNDAGKFSVEDDDDDLLETAAKAALCASIPVIDKPKTIATLLNKAPLASVFKDITGNSSAKQLYRSTESLSNSRQKRTQATSNEMPAKKQKISLLAGLNE